jgi:hypothetical protein
MRFAILRMTVLACLCALASLAQQQITVEKLLEFVNSSIATKVQDKDVAAYLATVKLSEKLDPRTVEDLRGKGAGPKTVAALTSLASASAGLPAPAQKAAAPKPKVRAAPSYEEQQKVIREVREYALNYSKTLPDFICLQVTRRYIDRHYKPGTDGSWSPSDRLAEKLTYFDQQEKYEAISHNDTSLFGKQADQFGGALSRGDFGTLIREIFDPASDAEFHWERWGNLDNKHWFHVYTYAIDLAHSHETISHDNNEKVTAAFHGEIFVEEGANVIWRITVEPTPPATFPVQDIHQVLDYRYIDLSGQPFLLPVNGTVIMRADGVGSKNEIDFRSYRKYAADATIIFDDSDKDPDPPKPDQPRQ